MAKSYHPQQLLDAYDLRQVGSRPVSITPEKWTRQGDPSAMASSELYVAGSRDAFQRWSRDLSETPGAVPGQIRQLEAVRAPAPTERLKTVEDKQVRQSETSTSWPASVTMRSRWE